MGGEWAKLVRGIKESTPEIIIALYANLDVNLKNYIHTYIHKIKIKKCLKKKKPPAQVLFSHYPRLYFCGQRAV